MTVHALRPRMVILRAATPSTIQCGCFHFSAKRTVGIVTIALALAEKFLQPELLNAKLTFFVCFWSNGLNFLASAGVLVVRISFGFMET